MYVDRPRVYSNTVLSYKIIIDELQAYCIIYLACCLLNVKQYIEFYLINLKNRINLINSQLLTDEDIQTKLYRMEG